MKQTKLVLAAVLAASAACAPDPTPPSGNLPLSVKPVPNKTVVNYPVPGPLTILPPSGIGLSDVMEFVVGEAKSYPVTAWVPSPGTPVVTFTGLPADAAYASTDPGSLSMTPVAADAQDPSDLGADARIYAVTLNLASSTDSTYTRTREFVIVVRKTDPGHPGGEQ